MYRSKCAVADGRHPGVECKACGESCSDVVEILFLVGYVEDERAEAK